MRELKFYVNGQRIKKDNTCDFSGIVAGTKGYLEAVFCFGSDWSGMSKVAVFTRLKEQHPTKIIKNKCIIPYEALTWRDFSVQVIGEKDGIRICTNQEIVEQEVI